MRQASPEHEDDDDADATGEYADHDDDDALDDNEDKDDGDQSHIICVISTQFSGSFCLFVNLS